MEDPEIERIVSSVRRAIAAEVLKLYTLPPNVVWVREVSGCLRQAFYNRVYYRVLDEKQTFAIFRGRLLHEWLLEKLPLGLSESSIKTAEKDMGGGLKLRGRADWIVGDYVIDFKYKLYQPSDAVKQDVNQVLLYMYLYNKPKGLILYIDWRGEIKPYRVERDESRIEELARKAITLHKSLIENKPPDPEVYEWCRWCPWASEAYCPEGYMAAKR